MPKLTSLEDLFVHEIQHIYHAEGLILNILRKLTDAASYSELKAAFEAHRRQTEGHVRRLERVFTLLDRPPRGSPGDGMSGLLREAEILLHEDTEPELMDAALIAAAQKIEHYEIASYGGLCTYAEILGYDQAHDLLNQTLDEEETTDVRLTELAEAVIKSPGSRRRPRMTKRKTTDPATDPNEVGKVLNELLETLRDGENGFRSAADAVEEVELKRLFLSLSSQRSEFASELEAELLRLGQEPAEHGHIAGAAHRGWINLKAVITGKDEGAIVSEAERGEDFAVTKFRESLQRGLPAEVQTIVERQFVQIQDAHDHVRSLERAFGRT